MKLQGNGSVEQLEKDKARSRCRKWKLWQRADGKNHGRRFDGTYRQALEALEAFRAELAGGVSDSMEFGAYAERWLRYRELSGELSAGTLRNNRHDIDTLLMFFSGRSIDCITADDVRGCFIDLRTKGGLAGRPLSGTSCNHIYVTLNAILSQAEDDGKIQRNPCRSLSAPRMDTRERKALTAEQLDGVFDGICRRGLDGFGMAVLLMCDTGMRSEEALALAPSDIDYARRVIHVSKALKEATNTIGRPKSAAGVRDIPMTDRLMAACREWDAIRDAHGVYDSETLVCNLDGSRWTLNTFRVWWRGVSSDVGAEGCTPHELRHSWLTKMGAFCNEFVLQKLAGWSSIAPARIYVHQDIDALYAAISRSQVTSSVHSVNFPSTQEKAGQAI